MIRFELFGWQIGFGFRRFPSKRKAIYYSFVISFTNRAAMRRAAERSVEDYLRQARSCGEEFLRQGDGTATEIR